eukprot:148424-Rhodomonas_salina.3
MKERKGKRDSRPSTEGLDWALIVTASKVTCAPLQVPCTSAPAAGSSPFCSDPSSPVYPSLNLPGRPGEGAEVGSGPGRERVRGKV